MKIFVSGPIGNESAPSRLLRRRRGFAPRDSGLDSGEILGDTGVVDELSQKAFAQLGP